MNKQAWVIFVASLLSTASAWSQPGGVTPYRGGPGMGPGMMGGAQGQLGCDGYGMMGVYGPGMMWGYEPGMMGGYGSERWGYNIPDLTDEQRNKILNIQKEFRQKQWALMEKMHEQNFQSGNFYRDGKLDEQAARKANEMRGNLQKQMFENYLEAQKRTDSALTSQQLKKLHEAGIR